MVLIGTVNDGFHLREIAPESRKHDVADGVVPAPAVKRLKQVREKDSLPMLRRKKKLS